VSGDILVRIYDNKTNKAIGKDLRFNAPVNRLVAPFTLKIKKLNLGFKEIYTRRDACSMDASVRQSLCCILIGWEAVFFGQSSCGDEQGVLTMGKGFDRDSPFHNLSASAGRP